MKYSNVLTTAAPLSPEVVVNQPRHADGWLATCFIYGTFGAGTVSVLLSPDGGTTTIPATNPDGSPITATANKVFNLTLGSGGRLTNCIKLYFSIAGSTAATVNCDVFDNRG